ncbi:hypothetical protein AZI87_14180 [Bdellovibrio bacteriovorus]|uniref:Uncharacterized protein n=1 Tax=Bdellovibrio bacteriovorus TaxID=959 RepID=A0A162G1R0_BDEBC|nr:hypothetical protein [Bdellovibrio bacteriovorus]KYG63552.1 hypothetical protein AZI87_14180 [Bdellovibrio bacteriovorus]
MRLAIKSVVLIASIPLFAFAIEPTNPSGFCDRFIGEKDIEACKTRTENEEVDWYAVTVCNLQKDDKTFWNCWESVKGKSFDPKALAQCTESEDSSDEDRQACVLKAGGNRKPASQNTSTPFQNMKIDKRGK